MAYLHNLGKTAEKRQRQRDVWDEFIKRRKANARVAKSVSNSVRNSVVTLPKISAPTLAEIESKYGKLGE